ncbi:MAG: ECF transporter S component [Christensenellales bacterium]
MQAQNTKKKIRMIAMNGMLIAITILMGFTPIGYIPIGPLMITLMCLPVIIGTILLGLKSGALLSIVFGMTSLAQALMGAAPLAAPLMAYSMPYFLIVTFFPRLVIPFVTYGVYKLISARGMLRDITGMLCAAIAGSLTNTILYLGMLALLFAVPAAEFLQISPADIWPWVGGVAVSNGLLEAAAAAIICTPIILSVKASGLLRKG